MIAIPLRRAAALTILAALLVPGATLARATSGAASPEVEPSIASDTTVYGPDEFTSLDGWTVTTNAQGTAAIAPTGGPDGSSAVRITVPNYTSNSIAYLKRTLDTPQHGISASGYFKVTSGGCDDSAGYSGGNVPFIRFFDGQGRRVAGLYRINGSCSKTAKVYVQHSGNYFRTNKNMSFGSWVKWELRISVGTPGSSLVQVYMNDGMVYESTIANNGTAPITSVNIGNEHNNQVGDFYADKFRIGSFDVAAPTNPCTASTAAPTTADPGTVLVADNFESFDFSKWSGVGLAGDGTATFQSAVVKSGTCAAKLHVTSNSSSKANLYRNFSAGTTDVYADGWFQVTAEGALGSNVPNFRFFNGTSRLVDVYRVNSTGELYLRLPNGSGGYTYTSLNRTRALNDWYSVNVHVITNGAASTVTVKIDGTIVFDRATVNLGTSALTSVMIGAEHFAQAGDQIVDDIVIKEVR